MKRSLQLALAVIVAVGAATAGYLTRAATDSDSNTADISAEATRALMSLTLPDTADVEQSLAQWQGKVLVVNFWATWCPPCLKEIPDFAAVSQQHANQPVQFVGISIDRADAVKRFADEYQVPYPLLIGSPATLEMAAAFGNTAQALPFTVIVDQAGKISFVKLGTLEREALEQKIQGLL